MDSKSWFSTLSIVCLCLLKTSQQEGKLEKQNQIPFKLIKSKRTVTRLVNTSLNNFAWQFSPILKMYEALKIVNC
jgi:hypothetical protein